MNSTMQTNAIFFSPETPWNRLCQATGVTAARECESRRQVRSDLGASL